MISPACHDRLSLFSDFAEPSTHYLGGSFSAYLPPPLCDDTSPEPVLAALLSALAAPPKPPAPPAPPTKFGSFELLASPSPPTPPEPPFASASALAVPERTPVCALENAAPALPPGPPS